MSKINSSTSPDRLGRELATAVIAFHETAARRAGMSAPESRCLGVLAELGVATPGQLAAATGLTTGAITGIVDRLEKAGYARRAPNPDDRRSLLVHAANLDRFGDIMGPVYASLGAAMAELSTGFTPDELGAISRYLAGTTQVLKAQTARLKGK